MRETGAKSQSGREKVHGDGQKVLASAAEQAERLVPSTSYDVLAVPGLDSTFSALLLFCQPLLPSSWLENTAAAHRSYSARSRGVSHRPKPRTLHLLTLLLFIMLS